MEFRVTGSNKNGEEDGGLGEEKTQGSIPGSGRSPGGGNGNPLQYSCLENPQNRGAQRTTVPWGRKELDMNERLRKPKKNEKALDLEQTELGPSDQLRLLVQVP